MATVTRETAEVIRLVLTLDEAATLRAVLRSLGGNPAKSHRRYTDAIERELEAAGVTAAAVQFRTEANSLYFID